MGWNMDTEARSAGDKKWLVALNDRLRKQAIYVCRKKCMNHSDMVRNLIRDAITEFEKQYGTITDADLEAIS